MVSKRYLNICIILFAAIFVLLPALSLITPQRDFSELENRVLQGWPSFSVSKLFSGEWIPQLEEMMNDQCFGRDGWVRLKATCDALLGKKDIGGAYLGGDGWLFEKARHARSEAVGKKLRLCGRFRAVGGRTGNPHCLFAGLQRRHLLSGALAQLCRRSRRAGNRRRAHGDRVAGSL